MIQMPVREKVSLADYLALPESNQITELIDGEIVVNPPRDAHQKTLWMLVGDLMPLLNEGEARFAPTGLNFDDGNSFEPDLFWVSPTNDRCRVEPQGRYWEGAPDLIIEVLSPTTEAIDRDDKYKVYERYGVREYWLVSPDARYAEVHRLEDGRFTRVGVFRPGQSFVSTVLGGATIYPARWFVE
jgi:Uma2 family endonuclease